MAPQPPNLDRADRVAAICPPETPPRGRVAWLPLAGLVLLHAALLSAPAVRNSVTVDEYAHLPAGLAYWRWGEWSIYHQSPPLLRLWAAWPALLAGAEVPPAARHRNDRPQDRYWNYADAHAQLNAARYHATLVPARMAMVAMSCAGVVLVFMVASRLYGSGGGLLAAALYAVCPNVAAHGSIVGTDVGTALASLAALWAWVEFARRPTPARALLAGAALAAALLCKFSTLPLVPIVALIVAWGAVAGDRRARNILHLMAGAAAAAIACLVLLNLAYGYSNSFWPLGRFRFQSGLMAGMAAQLPSWLPVPLPRDFVLGFDAAKWELEQPFQAFLLGRTYVGTDWRYYPVALLAKLPIGAIGVAVVALVSLIRHPPRLNARETPLLAALVLLGASLALGATVNIGVRYLLPVIALGYVLCGRVAGARAGAGSGGRRPRVGPRGVAWVLVACAAVEHATVWPRPHAFFNLAAGGSAGGQRVLADSNADWGQGLIDLREWMAANGVGRVQLVYFGRANPQIYGIRYAPAAGGGEEKYTVVSSHFRAGLAYRQPLPDGTRTAFQAVPFADVLERVAPVAVVGEVLYVYETAEIDAALRARP